MKIHLKKSENRKKGMENSQEPAPDTQNPQPTEDNTGEVVTAIGLALSMYMRDIHDFEQAVITMQKVMRPYSPWSSKFYGLKQQPMHIPGFRQHYHKS
ncbi:MAG: hypothetical protein M0R21_03870 [Lentimicrobiaceae bacterium]|jgi:hypothetical protein|nr:hypothetical protein [Lentimicrobiaceae bacterium]